MRNHAPFSCKWRKWRKHFLRFIEVIKSAFVKSDEEIFLQTKAKSNQNMLNLLVLLATVLAVTSATAPKSVEEAHKIIQDHVKSFGTGVGGLCDKNKCCTVSSTESCPISNMEKDSSTLVLPGGNTRCIFSDSTPFAFQVSRQFLFIRLIFMNLLGRSWRFR